MLLRICRMSMILRLFVALLLVFCSFSPITSGLAHAADPHVQRIEPLVRDGKLELSADVHFELNDQLRDAAQRGVPLYFTADLQITRSRWWWFDHTLVDKSITWRIAYNALTRQWRGGAGELSLPVASLDDAMDLVRHIRNWQVADASEFDPGVRYGGQLRVRLDTSQLARPFQVNALNSSSWSPATPWAEFSFALAEPARDPS
ncbi:DUF4390 domain-containing protein [Bordetella pertussis]|uniref:DUF4390 domain-containing protein n=1 Tax=Bordetella pertussis TaxID=520 RepID=UPI0005E4C701|nr:DUF4390 domain-containing protein [Bordetella pertussis]CFW90843.1 Uncharacterised protein [Bordetella pertussis]